MSYVTRRELLIGSAAFLGLAASDSANLMSPVGLAAEEGKVDPIAPDVYFHEGNIERDYCNQGWIAFEDYVLVIDANFPAGAEILLPKIRAVTNKPVRFAFDTHHHGDHAYGNQFWVDNGGTPVAHTGVIEEMKRYETGYYADKPGRWESEAKERPDVKASDLKPPSVLFPRELIFDDGKHRVELLHLGVAHTHGDAVAWLPKERILFTGDVCVNGPYNYVGDGDVEKWIATLAAARKLGAKVVCPGHGPRGAEDLLAAQQHYFRSLRERVGTLVQARKTPQQVRDSIEQLRAQLAADGNIARFAALGPYKFFPSQVEKVYTELTGKRFPAAEKHAHAARQRHAHEHGLAHVHR